MLQMTTQFTTPEEKLLQLVDNGRYDRIPLADTVGWPMAAVLVDNLFYSDVLEILSLEKDELALMFLSDIIASTEYWQYSDKVSMFCKVMRTIGKIA